MGLVLISFLLGCTRNTTINYNESISLCFKNKTLSDDGKHYIVDPLCIVGANLPSFKFNTLEGNTIQNSSLINKYSIINFWFIDCKPCVEEMPELNAIIEKYGREQVTYLAIANDSKEDIKEFLKSTAFNFDHVCDGEDINRKTFKSLWGFPLTIISDDKGIIIDVISGNLSIKLNEENALFNRIDKLLENRL